jgi:nucleoid DNA-binding protein
MPKMHFEEVLTQIEAITEYKGIKVAKVVTAPFINSMIAEDLGIMKKTADAVVELWLKHIFTQVKAGNEVKITGLCTFKPNDLRANKTGPNKGRIKRAKTIELHLCPQAGDWMNNRNYVNPKKKAALKKLK